MNGIVQIAGERARQIVEEGYTLDHDKEHAYGELAAAAAVYATVAQALAEAGQNAADLLCHALRKDVLEAEGEEALAALDAKAAAFAADPLFMFGPPNARVAPAGWPFEASAFHPAPTPQENLVKAGALVVAELERISA